MLWILTDKMVMILNKQNLATVTKGLNNVSGFKYSQLTFLRNINNSQNFYCFIIFLFTSFFVLDITSNNRNHRTGLS